MYLTRNDTGQTQLEVSGCAGLPRRGRVGSCAAAITASCMSLEHRTLSDDRVAPFLEDAEGSSAQGHKVFVAIADFGFDGGDAACDYVGSDIQ
jgi:hypothetical protein